MEIKLKQARNNDLSQFKKKNISIEELLIWCSTNECSDLYIKVGECPYISRYGKISKVPCYPTSKDVWSKFEELHISNELHDGYVHDKMLDTSVKIRIPEENMHFGKYDTNYFRYRVSYGFSGEKNIATFRMIRPNKITFNTINYPKECEVALQKAYKNKSGIIIFAAPTGAGKTSTMSACINTFSEKNGVLDNKVIITLEDPIENLYTSTDTFKITQKELGKDFRTFSLGIKQALREHPSNIIIGEMRDKEVIGVTIEASRTGHLCTTTFHGSNVGGTISRILYYLDNDNMLSYDLIINLNMIISQKLIPSDNQYIVDTQYLLFNDEITRIILNSIDNGKNIARTIETIIQNKDLQKLGYSKDWNFK